MAALAIWYWSERSVSVNTVATPKVEAFYWATITLSQTLGTALGDWAADTGKLGYAGGAFVFSAGLVIIATLYFWTNTSRVLLFWAAFILTRPLGATVGDILDKPLNDGGMALSRPLASAVIAIFIVGLSSWSCRSVRAGIRGNRKPEVQVEAGFILPAPTMVDAGLG